MPRPRLEKKLRKSSLSARPSTCGPTTIPSTISTTTPGSGRRRAASPAMRADNAATLTTVRKEPVSTLIMAAQVQTLSAPSGPSGSMLPQRERRTAARAGPPPRAALDAQLPLPHLADLGDVGTGDGGQRRGHRPRPRPAGPRRRAARPELPAPEPVLGAADPRCAGRRDDHVPRHRLLGCRGRGPDPGLVLLPPPPR